jgi:hypothetical protein
MVVLAAERCLTAGEIAEIVRASEQRRCAAGSSATWPAEWRDCAM